MFWKLLLIAAFFGMLVSLWEPLEGKISNGLSWILSFFILGLFLGILLSGIMIIGEFLCICSDVYIFGCHPFWIGLVIGSVWSIISRFIFWIKYR